MGTVEKDEWGQLDREHLADKLASWQDAEAQVRGTLTSPSRGL